MSNALDEAGALAGEIVALTALPARWIGTSPERIADDVAATLYHLCDDVLLVQVRLDLPPRSVTSRRPEGGPTPTDEEAGPRFVRATNELALPIGRFGRHGEILLVAAPGADLSRPGLLATIAANQVEAACRALDLERDVAQAHAKVAALGKLGALGQLVGGVAHEIRTPLTYAANYLHLLKRDVERRYPDSAHHVAPHIREMEAGLERIEAIVQQLRRVVKHESAVHIEEDLRGLVQEAIRLWRATHAGGCAVVLQLAPTPPVLVDRGQLQQVVLNLVQNAFEATGLEGTVRVETVDEGTHAVLVVTDDGPGMDAETLRGLFQPFRTTKPDGLGLGLSIVRDIVQAHHGSVDIDSTRGRGTIVRVRIPRAGGAA